MRPPPAVPARREIEAFRIDVRPERQTVRVAPVGELDLATVAPLRERLDELREPGCRSVVLDLRGVTFIDASALHLLVSRNAHARESGIEFTIIQGPAVVRRLFDITGLLDWLPFRAMSAENGASVTPSTSPVTQTADTAAPAKPGPYRGCSDESEIGDFGLGDPTVPVLVHQAEEERAL